MFFGFFKFICLFWDRERACTRVGEGQRENLKQSSAVRARQPDVGLDLVNRKVRTWTDIKSRSLNQLSHPGAQVFWTLYVYQILAGDTNWNYYSIHVKQIFFILFLKRYKQSSMCSPCTWLEQCDWQAILIIFKHKKWF